MATITEDYVSFETAKLLKEKGFNGDTASCYILEDSTHHIMSDKVVQSEYYESQDSNEHGHLIQAPTLQMAMKWLREVHNIYYDVHLLLGDKAEKYGDLQLGVYQLSRFEAYRWECWLYANTYEELYKKYIKYCLEHLI